jgi:hypothetical protein
MLSGEGASLSGGDLVITATNYYYCKNRINNLQAYVDQITGSFSFVGVIIFAPPLDSGWRRNGEKEKLEW